MDIHSLVLDSHAFLDLLSNNGSETNMLWTFLDKTDLWTSHWQKNVQEPWQTILRKHVFRFVRAILFQWHV